MKKLLPPTFAFLLGLAIWGLYPGTAEKAEAEIKCTEGVLRWIDGSYSCTLNPNGQVCNVCFDTIGAGFDQEP